MRTSISVPAAVLWAPYIKCGQRFYALALASQAVPNGSLAYLGSVRESPFQESDAGIGLLKAISFCLKSSGLIAASYPAATARIFNDETNQAQQQ